MLRRRLLWQLYPPYLTITITAIIVIAWYSSYSLERFYYNQVAQDLKSRAYLIKSQISDDLNKGEFDKLNELCVSLGKVSSTRITIILPDGKVIADSDENPQKMKNHANRPEFIDAVKENIGRSIRSSETLGKDMMYLAVTIKDSEKTLAVIRTSVPATALTGELKKIYSKIVLAVIILAVVAALISLELSRRLSKPIKQMKEIAGKFAQGEFDLRLAESKSTELAELATSLNEMARQLQKRINTITRQKNKSQAILSSMVEGVIALDTEGLVVSINNAAAIFLQVKKEEVIGKNIEQIVRNSQLQDFIKITLESEDPTEGDIKLSINGGKYFGLNGAKLVDDTGSTNGIVIVLNDVTHLRRLEDVRRDFVANVSHELRTPITSIKGFVETLLEGALDKPEEARRFLKIIERHSNRLNAIIEDLLSLSRLEEASENRKLSFESTEIKMVISEASELSQHKISEKNMKLKIECNKNLTGNINAALIEQAIANLIDNAVKYSSEGNDVLVAAHKVDSDILISVTDNGCGIEKKHLERIFERFYVVDKARSRTLGGTGLGLAIVKHIAQVHGGFVTADSSLGKGSTFTIHLPAQQNDQIS